jgi:hypothetical protein
MPEVMLAASLAVIACVGVTHPDCTTTADTLSAALAQEPSVVRLGPGPYSGSFTATAPVEIAGSEGTVIDGDLAAGALALHNVRLSGTLSAGPGTVKLDDADLAHVALDHADTTGRGLTVTAGIAADGGSLALASSVVLGGFAGTAQVSTAYSAHAEDPAVTATDRVDPPADPREVAGSTLQDAGDPASLAAFEPFEDAAARPRIAFGRRDIGAYEAPAPAAPIPPDSVLVNGGAEDGLDGWTGTFTAAAYGDPFLPSARTGVSLGGGAAFFSAADAADAELAQRIDVTRAAASIDAGRGRAALSALVGGYGADADTASVRAVFKDPENNVLATLELPKVTTADRANATNLLPRTETRAIPARTRAIDVLLHGERAAGTYTDAYVDNVALELSVPGVPGSGGPDDPPVTHLKPFAGISVLTAEPAFARRVGRVLLGCASSTVGACTGWFDLVAGGSRIAPRVPFAVAPGATATVDVQLRKRLRKPRAATLRAVSHDGQGLQRRTRIPVTLVPARRRARVPRSAGTAAARTPRPGAGRSAA